MKRKKIGKNIKLNNNGGVDNININSDVSV